MFTNRIGENPSQNPSFGCGVANGQNFKPNRTLEFSHKGLERNNSGIIASNSSHEWVKSCYFSYPRGWTSTNTRMLMRSRSYNRDVDMENLYESDSGYIYIYIYTYIYIYRFNRV